MKTKHERYCEELSSQIRNPFIRKKVMREIAEHLEDASEYYGMLHFSKDEAEKMALRDFGEVELVAQAINEVYSLKEMLMSVLKFIFMSLLLIFFYLLMCYHFTKGL